MPRYATRQVEASFGGQNAKHPDSASSQGVWQEEDFDHHV